MRLSRYLGERIKSAEKDSRDTLFCCHSVSGWGERVKQESGSREGQWERDRRRWRKGGVRGNSIGKGGSES